MSEKKFLKLLIKSFGLKPFKVESFVSESNVTSESVTGWKGKGTDLNNDVVIDFNEKTGFKAAVYEILTSAESAELKAIQVK